jgi:predicted metal-dependent HD superfamily phosphohydrolase
VINKECFAGLLFDPLACIDRVGLRSRYAEPWRHYHDLSHLDALFDLFSGHCQRLDDPFAVYLAIWYHDAVYDPKRSDNEAASARLLTEDMAQLPVAIADAITDVSLTFAADMILATAGHQVPLQLSGPQAKDCALFLDMDLSVLGADPTVYQAYENGIASEYVPIWGPDAYKAGRKKVLEALLARPRLYFSQAFSGLEKPARENLSQALAGLI